MDSNFVRLRPRKRLQAVLQLLLILPIFFSAAPAMASEKWQGQIPKIAENPDDWSQLVTELMNHEMYFGALAGSHDILNFFSDLNSKELAYGTIIKLIDLGYPFSTRAYFIPGDIDPPGKDNFGQSYLLYKALVNVDKKMLKWADYYFNKIDKDNFPKYLFFQAREAYVHGQPYEAMDLLRKILQQATGPESLSLAKKAARTLARIRYELGQYDKSFEIYDSFLLKLNPVTPSDWLDAAWSQYQLKHFSEALGLLYNFESHASGPTRLLEKYVLRALIHREYCSVASTDALIRSFQADFGEIIDGIKLGEPLTKYPMLAKIEHPETQEYRQFTQTLSAFESESARVGELPARLQSLAKFLYSSESAMMVRSQQIFQDRALEALARHLVILSESLRFLKFDVARERFDPDRVFAAPPPVVNLKLIDETDDKNFRVHWLQWGDYWRDERLLYRGLLENKCEL